MNAPQAFVCPTCSAPLEAPNAQGFSHCRFCGTVVEPRLTHAQSLPPAPQPLHQPVVYMQPFGAVPLVTQQPAAVNAGRSAGLIVAAVVVLPILIGGISTVFSATSARSSLFADVTSLPAICSMNQTINLKNVSYNGVGTAVTAQDNCTINITGGSITATTVIRAVGANVRINLSGATLAGTSDAIGLADNSHLRADGTTKITSSSSAISGVGYNPEVTLDHTKVQGSVAGIDLADNATVTLLGADVRGATGIRANDNAHVHLSGQSLVAGTVAGIVLQDNADINLQASTVQAQGEAIQVGSNATLDGNGSKVTGGTAAIDVHGGGALSRNSLSGSAVTGPHLVDGHPDPSMHVAPAVHAAPAPAPVAPHPMYVPPPAARGRRW